VIVATREDEAARRDDSSAAGKRTACPGCVASTGRSAEIRASRDRARGDPRRTGISTSLGWRAHAALLEAAGGGRDGLQVNCDRALYPAASASCINGPAHARIALFCAGGPFADWSPFLNGCDPDPPDRAVSAAPTWL